MNKQDQGTMQTAIKILLAFGHFKTEGHKLGPFLVTKYVHTYIKNQIYQNILLIKVGLPFSYSSIKKMIRISAIFDIEK